MTGTIKNLELIIEEKLHRSSDGRNTDVITHLFSDECNKLVLQQLPTSLKTCNEKEFCVF